MTNIKGFFNPTKAGDTFKGLNSSIEGRVADRVIGDVQSFMREAGRDYYIKKVPAYQRLSSGDFAELENQFHLVRSTDERVVSPHTVTEQYTPLSLMEMAEEVKPWCDAGWCTPDGVYSARNESLEVLSLRLDASGQLPDGERFIHYIVFQNPHGSGGTAKGKIISWRIVCANTFAAAITAKSDFAISHRTASGTLEVQSAIMADRAKQAVTAWEQAKDHIGKLAEKINAWQSVPLQFADAKNLTERLLDIRDEKNASQRSLNRRDAILGAFSMPQFGTNGRNAYDWLNGVTFVNSSPLADANKKSKVSAIDRAVRTIDVNGTGFALEQRAEKLLAELLA